MGTDFEESPVKSVEDDDLVDFSILSFIAGDKVREMLLSIIKFGGGFAPLGGTMDTLQSHNGNYIKVRMLNEDIMRLDSFQETQGLSCLESKPHKSTGGTLMT